MTPLENMLKHLIPLQLYKLDEDSNVYNELSAYSNAFEHSIAEADMLLKEMLITTAEDYGLSSREKIWGLPRTELTTEERRKAIIERFCINYSDCTLKAMQNFLMSLGVKPIVTEVPSKYRMYVYVENGSTFSIPVRKYINEQVESFFPAHIEVFLDYRVADWNKLDNNKTMFDTYDSFNYTWDRAEHIE